MDESIPLKRSLSQLLVMFYGLGTILGAGIYVLVGKVAAKAGIYTPFAFLLAAGIALFTAVSYAELSSRFPKSAGEAFYVQHAFAKAWLSRIVGWMVVLTGVVSAAAITRGFTGYFQLFIPLPDWACILLLVLVMGFIAIWGIKESAFMVMLITLIEVLGLVIIIYLAHDQIGSLPALFDKAESFSVDVLTGIGAGAFLAFYSYIGFEDMVNVAEEIKDPERNLPRAIFLAFGIATVLYFLVALAMLSTMPLPILAASDAPLATFMNMKGHSSLVIGFISLIAIVNGALAQVIMASRVMYGMAKQGTAPHYLGQVYAKTQTPVIATLVVVTIILILALGFNIEGLAKITSLIILVVFMLIHAALIKIKVRREVDVKAAAYSIAFPIVGLITSFLFFISAFI